MRKTLLILTLAAVTVLASASDAFAQRRGGGNGGGRGGYSGGRSGFSISLGTGSGYYGNYGNYGNYGYNSRPYYSGYSGSQYYYTQPYYYGTQTYYTNPIVQVQAVDVRPSFYTAPVTSQFAATVTVLVPHANAQIWFDNTLTSQQGMERSFSTPALTGAGTYTIRARWTENGQAVQRERQVTVQPGQAVTVSFRGNQSEPLPLPK